MKFYKYRYNRNYSLIKDYYKFLIEKANDNQYVGIINEWIIDNFFQLAEMEVMVKNYYKSKKAYYYSFVKKDMYPILNKIISKNNFRVDEKYLISQLNEYQSNYDYYFSYNQLDCCPIVSYFCIVEEIAQMCETERLRLEYIEEAEKVLDKLRSIKTSCSPEIVREVFSEADEAIYDRYFLEHINSNLKEIDDINNNIFKMYSEMLKKRGIDYNVALEQVYRASSEKCVYISNLFFSVSKINKIKIEKLYNKVCAVEKVLCMDSFFEKMTSETKHLYRENLIKAAKRKHINEYDYAKSLLKDSLMNDRHIGEYLMKNKKIRLNTFLYLFSILAGTVLLTCCLSNYLFESWLVGFIIVIIPVSEIIYLVLNRIIMFFSRPKPVPMMDFSTNGVDEEHSTIIMITTILKNGKKVKLMYDTLLAYYLANKSDNLYFVLLGDCSSYETESAPYDNDIVISGLTCCKAMNEKVGKDIFHFAYRKRHYSEGEGCFLGYERKRGAIEQFNELVLGKLTDAERRECFTAQTLGNFNKKIKYIITLDTDTRLVLGTAFKLIGAMSHPLNKPVLNKKGTRVIDGYGIMQPKIDVDIESANKSLFAQIYAGLGGFDVYNTVVPNIGQDLFNEGNFVGKGIYDLEVFDSVLGKKMPENLILSHDLLEGSYVRCGYLSDVELFDDFPPTYLVDSTRRHRWARGDMQIISWVFKKNPLSILQRWRIFNNIRMGLVDFMLVVLLFSTMLFGKNGPVFGVIVTIAIIGVPILFYVMDKFSIQRKQHTKAKQYVDIAFGIRAMVVRTWCQFSAIPYNARLYMDAFLKALYRMLFSKKKLLNWMTAEEAEKIISGALSNYLIEFIVNYFVAAVFVVMTAVLAPQNIVCASVIAACFLGSPFLLYYISLPKNYDNDHLSEEENNDVRKLAFSTWRFFDLLITKEHNYLIPDNYQLNRQHKEDYKTSSTNIGFSLVSIISAMEMCFITPERAFEMLKNIVGTVEKLEKWNGHLYNWYDITTLRVLPPSFVSSVDSGNMVASMMTVVQFLKTYKQYELADRFEKMVNATDFTKVYDAGQEVFSVGYTVSSNIMEPYAYNRFASEARLTSFVAIAKGDIDPKHWFCLDKTLTIHKGYKGLLSWSGSMFEYYMPLIFMKDYANTLVDESYYFSVFCQREYMREVNPELPWGISEGAYYELDDGKNFKYKDFGIPHLRLKGRESEHIVITSYSSLMALPKFPHWVYENLQKLRKLGMQGDYGLFESFDYKKELPVPIYYAHHQGMILASIANYLNDNIIQKYFQKDDRIASFDILNKEKVQMDPLIDFEIARYKKYVYNKEHFENDIRVYTELKERPETTVLSNSRFLSYIDDRGNGFLRYKNTYLNRTRSITRQDYGMYLYVKDNTDNKIFSNTYAPVNKMPEEYEAIFALDSVKFIRKDDDIKTETHIIVTDYDNVEIRKITFKNLSDKEKDLSLTSYAEVVLSSMADDYGHRVFNNMFVKSEYDKDNCALIFKRTPRNSKESVFMGHKLLIHKPISVYEYETERENFVERNGTYSDPKGLRNPLTCYTGDNLDPIASIRNEISVGPYESKEVYMINIFAKSETQIKDLLKKYEDENHIEDAFSMASVMASKVVKKLDVSCAEVGLYNRALNMFIPTTKINLSKDKKHYLERNVMTQRNLWRFGISGDTDIILVEIHNVSSLGLAKNVIKMFEYYKGQCISVDVVIVNSSIDTQATLLKTAISEEIYRINATNKFAKMPGKVYLLEREEVSEQEVNLLRAISRLYLDSEKGNSLKHSLKEIEKKAIRNIKQKCCVNKSLPIEYPVNELKYFNGYGGFKDDGSEYIITNPDTPKPWSNIIANDNMGTVITNNANGFTYFRNSREFKVTKWTNDMIIDDKSESLCINGREPGWQIAKHGIGYSSFEFASKEYELSATYFIPPDENVKVGIFEIKNITNEKVGYAVNYWIAPVLGTTEEMTTRQIVSNYMEEENLYKFRDPYLVDYQNYTAYLTSTEDIKRVHEGVTQKSILTYIRVEPGESVKFVFALGCEENEELITNTAQKYHSLKHAEKQFEETKKYWKKRINKVNVRTGEEAFDFMINYWLLYQTLMARVISRTGFYQVSGAFGFRDQLQDSMNIVDFEPEIAKKQLLRCAGHQFVKGDVLHWWHEDKMFGLRSQFKDDYIWLVYAAYEYLVHTGDAEILEERVPFVDGFELNPGEEERGIEYIYNHDNNASLYNHLALVIDKAMTEIGENGIPLMGGGDWNDGMNHIGIGGKGTSVWLGFFMYEAVQKFIYINEKYKNIYDNEYLLAFMEKLKKSIIKNAWDGEYFVRAFYDDGSKVGASECEECKIDLISQSFSILSGICDEDNQEYVFESIDKFLMDADTGIVKLLTPPFTNSGKDPGYIKNYPKGIRENGGQYTHSCVWYIMALIKSGQFDKAFNTYQMINPINHSLAPETADIYTVEPYVIAADIYSNEKFNGRGGWTWYTGSSGWFFRAGLQEILGFTKTKDRLMFYPNLPSYMNGFEMEYRHGDSLYNIDLEIIRGGGTHEDYVEMDSKILVNGNECEYIELVDDGQTYEVEVSIYKSA